MPTPKEKKDIEFIEAHLDFPDPRCRLFFKDVFSELSAPIVELTHSNDRVVSELESLKRTIHGENFDNGMALSVRANTKSISDMEGLPDELRKQVTRWGFYLLGIMATMLGVAIKIFLMIG